MHVNFGDVRADDRSREQSQILPTVVMRSIRALEEGQCRLWDGFANGGLECLAPWIRIIEVSIVGLDDRTNAQGLRGKDQDVEGRNSIERVVRWARKGGHDIKIKFNSESLKTMFCVADVD